MRRFPNWTLNKLLVGAVPACVLLGVATGHWTVGAGAAAAALCALAIRNPNWRPRWKWQVAEPTDENNQTVDWSPPPAPRPPTARRAAADDSLVEQMIAQGREALLLRPQIAANLNETDLASAQVALDEAMAIVPQGAVNMRARCYDDFEEADAPRGERLVQVEGFFLDRFPVTNAQYQLFVSQGGYEQMSLWDESIWPAVLGFTDETGQPGPRLWQQSKHPHGKEDHPVVGVCWYEAAAYARWAGKRLPTDPEWVKAGCWPVATEANKPVQRKYPWGDAMDRRLVNLWGNGVNDTVAVTASPGSGSVGGVQQLVGNVWEWTSSSFGTWEPTGRKVETAAPLKSIRGGAFDTYFDNQAGCQFQSGEAPLARKHNIGFRCCLGFCDVTLSSPSPGRGTSAAAATEREEVHA
ncbi:MAG: SUMF1/EgtB/PvdO family nonheme iron enzyme [Pirellulaceae bacterium]